MPRAAEVRNLTGAFETFDSGDAAANVSDARDAGHAGAAGADKAPEATRQANTAAAEASDAERSAKVPEHGGRQSLGGGRGLKQPTRFEWNKRRSSRSDQLA